MNCKHCGLAIYYKNMGPGAKPYLHLASVNPSEMITCAYANSTGSGLSSAMRVKYPTESAEPEDTEVPDKTFAHNP